MSTHCSIPECRTGYVGERLQNKIDGRKQISIFRPGTAERLRQWQKAVPRSGKLLSKSDAICELHFEEKNIEREYVIPMPDGTICRIPRGKPLLKKGAIPTLLLGTSRHTPILLRTRLRKKNTVPNSLVSLVTRRSVLHECQLAIQEFQPVIEKPERVIEKHQTVIEEYQPIIEKPQRVIEKHQTVIEKCQPVIEKPQTVIGNHQTVNGECRSVIENCEPVTEEHQSIIEEPAAAADRWKTVELPSSTCFFPTVHNNTIWTCWANDLNSIAKRVVLRENMSVEIFIEEKKVSIAGFEIVRAEHNDIATLLKKIAALLPCRGIEGEMSKSRCAGYVMPRSKGKRGPQMKHCVACTKWLHYLTKKRKKPTSTDILRRRKLKLRNSLKNTQKLNLRMKRKITKLQEKVEIIRRQCGHAKKDAVLEAISKLPDTHKSAVEACFAAAKVKNLKGMRYTNKWVFECLLLRIKSRKTYEHLRRHKILALPTTDTLNRYIRKIGSTYGFQESTFRVLKNKTAHMDSKDKHGVLLVDEMKLSKAVSFNSRRLEVQGFTNLGKYTPLHQVGKRGDHALVLMFQPFQGKWVQTLGCFLSKGCASGTILHQIILECVILTENSGLYIDAVTCDGASWNRAMWERFSINEENVGCIHPVDPKRQLWFLSDFPHLIKNTRNAVTKFEETWTPDGIIKLKHWDALVKIENPKGFNLKAEYKLTEEHIRPKYYQKMNVALAFQFFGIADPMALYENTHCDLYDSRASQTFCRRMKELINAMNSRTPDGAMMVENQAWKVVEDFLTYLRLWEKHAEMNSCTFLSNSTCYGLKISLQATLEVCQYLTKVCGFKFMMTARLNQDALERFFGMMRSCCGSNDHPDSTLFIQMYRLISTYSLIKPPKGSNVSGGDTLSVLMNIKDITDTDERKAQWIAQLDTIIDRVTDTDVLSNAVAVLEEHDYYKQGTSDYVLAYISGYIARKCKRFAVFHEFHQSRTCNECIATLQWPATEEIPESHKLIEIKSKGYLLHPSQQLFNLISVLERATLDTLSTQQLNINTIFQITKNVLDLSPIPLIGCSEHQDRLTHNIIRFFLTTRMHFISKQSNKNDNRENRQTQERRKAAKLSSCADDSNKENSTANGSKRKAPSTKKPSKKKKNSPVHLASKITMASGRKRTEFLSKNNRKLEVLKQLQ